MGCGCNGGVETEARSAWGGGVGRERVDRLSRWVRGGKGGGRESGREGGGEGRRRAEGSCSRCLRRGSEEKKTE